MKRTLLITCFVSCYSFFAFSQISAGPKCGLNFSTVKGGTKDFANKMVTGFHLGAYINCEVTNFLSIEPEAIYSRKGFKSDLRTADADTNLKHTFSYIDFPLLFCIRIADNAAVNFGPQIGYIINARSKGEISNTAMATTQNIDENTVYGYHTTEYSFAAGGAYKFNFGLRLSLGGTYGITKLYDNGAFSHNITFLLSVGYVFGSGGGGAGGGRGSGNVYKTL